MIIHKDVRRHKYKHNSFVTITKRETKAYKWLHFTLILLFRHSNYKYIYNFMSTNSY